MRHSFSPHVAALWCSAIVSGFWVIWRTRNAAIFYTVSPSIHRALRSVWTCIKETDFFKVGTMFNSLEEFRLLCSLRIKEIPRKAPVFIEVCWQPPPQG